MDNIDSEIHKEYQKINDEKIVSQQVIDSFKKGLQYDLLNGYMGDELKHCNDFKNVSYKRKITLKMKLQNFLNKLKIVLTGSDGIE